MRLKGTSKNLLRDQSAALLGARNLAYLHDMSRFLCSVRLASWPLITIFRGALERISSTSLTIFLIVLLLSNLPAEAAKIELFAGTVSKPAIEDAIAEYHNISEDRVELHLGGSGAMLSKIILTSRGDLYLPGSSDFLEKAKRAKIVNGPETILAYLLPAIIVAKNNPKNIKNLSDLLRPEVAIAIANPQMVCIGLYAVEIFRRASIDLQIKERLKNYTESCSAVARSIALGSVDAVIGWKVFGSWMPDKIEAISLPPLSIPRIGYIPIAKTIYSPNNPAVDRFIDFLRSDAGKRHFRHHGYYVDYRDIKPFAPQAKLGGEYILPKEWQ